MWHWLVLALVWATAASADEATRDLSGLTVDVVIRTSEGVAAFYEARGFPPEALAVVRDACFIGVIAVNRTREVIWIEPGRWEFRDARGALPRLTPEDWNRRWDRVALEPAKRATFRWTQLPDARDLQPDEPVGGNVTLPAPRGPVTVTMKFRSETTGQDRTTEFGGILCGETKK